MNGWSEYLKMIYNHNTVFSSFVEPFTIGVDILAILAAYRDPIGSINAAYDL